MPLSRILIVFRKTQLIPPMAPSVFTIDSAQAALSVKINKLDAVIYHPAKRTEFKRHELTVRLAGRAQSITLEGLSFSGGPPAGPPTPRTGRACAV